MVNAPSTPFESPKPLTYSNRYQKPRIPSPNAAASTQAQYKKGSLRLLHDSASPPPASALCPPSSSTMTPDTIASAIIYLVGVSVVSHLISRRVLIDGAQCSLRQASWPRICVLIIFLDSYLFIFTAGVLILGVEMRTSSAACALGIYLCVVFYWSSKFFIYLFLGKCIFPLQGWRPRYYRVLSVERVYVVWRPTPTASRWHSKVYMACMILLAPYFGVAALMFYGNRSDHRSPGN